MKAFGLTLLIGLVMLFAFACNQPATETITNSGPARAASPAAATPDEFASARTVFNKSCAGCHGEDGSGGTKTVDNKKLKVPSMRQGHSLEHTDDEFRKQITEGGDGMPAFKEKLTPEQMNDLVKFIRHDFQGK